MYCVKTYEDFEKYQVSYKRNCSIIPFNQDSRHPPSFMNLRKITARTFILHISAPPLGDETVFIKLNNIYWKYNLYLHELHYVQFIYTNYPPSGDNNVVLFEEKWPVVPRDSSP